MFRFLFQSFVILSLSLLLNLAHAQTQTAKLGQGQILFHFCTLGGATRTEGSGAQMRSVPMPLYASDIFSVPRDTNIDQADSIAFGQFVGSKYDPYFKGAKISCRGNFPDVASAQVAKQRLENTYRNNARLSPHTYPNPNVIETGWKWDGHYPGKVSPK